MGKNHKYRNEILNHRFGKLIAIEFVGLSKNQKRTLWKCKCDCGGEKVVRSDCLRAGATISCGCINKLRGKNCIRYKGYEDICGQFWGKIKNEGIRRGKSWDISIEYV